MNNQSLALAAGVAGVVLMSCSTSSPNPPPAQGGARTAPKNSPTVRQATSPRYIPPARPRLQTPAEPTRPLRAAGQPVVLPGEQLLASRSAPSSYSVKVRGVEWVSLQRWGALQRGWYGRLRKGADDSLHRLVIAGMRFDLRPKRRILTCQGMQIWLGFSPELINGHLYVHHLDIRKHLTPLANGMPSLGRVAVIDAGHGRDNKGTRSVFNKKYEKDYSLDWALRLKPLLERKGWRVFLTRSADSGMSLTDRVKFADRVKATLFISLHFNAAARSVSGLETYCIAPLGMPSHLTRGHPDRVNTQVANNPWDESSFMLAARVHNQLLLSCRMTDRGVRRVRFMSVIKGQKRPAILVEGGYLSNPTEARKIDAAAYRQKHAEGIAAAL